MIRVDERIAVAGALEAEDLAAARDAGIRMVIDLREDTEPVPSGLDPEEEPEAAAEIGIVHRRLPVGPRTSLRRAFGDLDALLADAPGPALIHCASGRRAVAAAVAVLGRAGGWTPAACIRQIRSLGFETTAMPPLGEAVVDYATRGPGERHVAGVGLGI